jgi:hypothetical protein
MRAQHTRGRNMNRHDRRAAQAKARRPAKNGISKIVAVHEAGHAVAKVLAAGELGYSINEAVKYIDMGTGESLHQSVDGKMMLRSQAVTFGPIFSRDINAASQQFREACLSEYKTTGAGPEEHLFRRKVVELGRAAGADIGKWFRARVFDAVSGSIAEAIVSNRSFHDVWNGYEAESDGRGVLQDAAAADLAAKEVVATMKRMAVVSAYLMDKPDVWAAVLALANKLSAVGRMDGTTAAAIIAGIIPETDLAGMFGDSLERITELEREISVNRLVIVKTPDGLKDVTKGKELLQKIKDGDIDGIEALQYECTLPIFAETLWGAFGDGNASREGASAA